jgi:hypothetical protein
MADALAGAGDDRDLVLETHWRWCLSVMHKGRRKSGGQTDVIYLKLMRRTRPVEGLRAASNERITPLRQ